MDWYLPLAWQLHASPPLKILIRLSGRDYFKGEGRDTTGVYFMLCREIGPELISLVEIFDFSITSISVYQVCSQKFR